ncbi:hypothetical protein RB594_006328 [Gaeumannomyces avenae]
MADDRRDRFPPPPPPPPPPRGQYNNQYPPPPIEEEDRQSRVIRDPRDLRDVPNAVTLPSIQDYPPSGPSRGPPPALEPGARGSYSVSPDQGAYPPPRPTYSLPPVQSLADGRAFDNRAPDSRGPPPPPPPPQQDPRQPMAYRPVPPPDPNAYYRGPPSGPPPPPYVQDPYQQQYAAYPQPQVGIMGYDYRTGPGMQQQQASAPRQRTSIACRYCRKRKIRCSGYQTTADGKCLNCKKTGNECVFQPVSSGSTAFVPVQAIQGGVIAPGTQLFGAFGQPLPMGAQGPPMPMQMQMQMPGQGPPPRHTPPQLPLPSPTGSYYEERVETGRRRPRGPEDDHHGPRLPPPHPGQIEEDPRRRSPASPQSASPPSLYQAPYPPRPASNTPPTAAPYPTAERATTYPPRLESPPAPPTAGPSTSSTSSSVMSLGNLMDNAPPRTAPGSSNGESRDNIDNFMLGRLGRRS